MIRDPFYRDIENALAGRLDPELFERCAADLLRNVHPTLVPIRGGDDAGMDGAIADDRGLPFPLVTTTSQRPLDNLRRSLTSYVKRGGTRRSVVFATSQALTAPRREKLNVAAGSRGFTLVQIHDRAAFADLLYRDPAWCRELLGLTGEPPALSVMPAPSRPLVGDALVGRADDLAWLESTDGDVLVVGQPGSGKTFLLHYLAKRTGGLFVHTADLGAIAAGVRAQRPTALILDDAHLELRLVEQLRRLRAETGATFRIIANCWPGSRTEVARVMDLPSESVRALPLLSKDDVAEVVKGTGIGGPRGLIQEIVNQAEGKPGLAVTLCNLCLRGDIRALAHGDALAAEIVAVFGRLIGGGIAQFLAAFAVGGNRGMPMDAVARYLERPLDAIREFAAKLAVGGVLAEVNQERLEVRPPALRHALVRDVFFQGPTSLPIEPLLAAATSLDDVTRTVIGAIARGARVSPFLIHEWVEQSRAHDVWAMYAGLGRQEAQWVASDHPEWLARIGDTMLHVAPDLVLPALLDTAVEDSRPLHRYPDHPLRRIGDWVIAARPGTPAVMERRQQLRDAVDRWWRAGGDPAAGLHALSLSLSPAFRRTESVPGSGRAFTFYHGFITFEDARAIRALWPSFRDRLHEVEPRHWGPVRELVRAWAYHGLVPAPLPEDLAAEANAFAGEMLRDIVAIATGHPGIIYWAREIADHLGVDLGLPVDTVYETLFPERAKRDWRTAEAAQRERASDLADEWARSDPAEVVPRLLQCEQEAHLTGYPWPRWTPFVCGRIAQEVADPVTWLDAILEGGGAPDLAQPFLRRLIQEGSETAHQRARRCLDDERQRLATAITLLSLDAIPVDLLELALNGLEGGAQWINTLCLRSELPESSVHRLLTHPVDAIASAAAIGEWNADPAGTVRASLQEAWRGAILRSSGEDGLLGEILRTDSGLAVEWLSRVFRQTSWLWRHDETINVAIQVLGREDRRRLINQIPEDLYPPEVLRELIGGDVELYRELLQIQRLRNLHLATLIGHPNPSTWAVMAQQALEAGYSTKDIAMAAFGHGSSWSGNESDMWAEWVQRFAQLEAHEDQRICEVGRIGSEYAVAQRDRALEGERAEAVRGF